MTWLRYTVEPRNAVSAGRSREVGFDRPAYEVLPGSVVRGALGSQWWLEAAGPQDDFDELFGADLTVHAAVPSLGDEVAQLIPMTWSKPKYGDGAFEAVPATVDNGRVAGRGWVVPREWMTATTHTALTGGVATDGALFTRRSSGKGVRFSGYLRVDDDPQSVKWLLQSRDVSVGGQLSVLGRCRWTCEETEDPYPAPESAGGALLVALQPLILLDEYGAPSLDLARAIEDCVGAAGTAITVEDVRSRPISVGGWHGRAGMPKPMDWALDAGSTALLKADTTAAWAALHDGLGIRRLEGYGAVALMAPDRRPSVSPAPRAVQPADIVEVTAASTAPPTALPLKGMTAGDLVELALRVPDAGRAQVVKNLIDLARSLEQMQQNPMQRMAIPTRLQEARAAQWLRDVPPDVADGLLDALKRSSDRITAIATLEGLR